MILRTPDLAIAARNEGALGAACTREVEHAVREQATQVQPDGTIEEGTALCKVIYAAAVHGDVGCSEGRNPCPGTCACKLFNLNQDDMHLWPQVGD